MIVAFTHSVDNSSVRNTRVTVLPVTAFLA